ncbi:MAG: methyltransferase, partial [Deltaproteobacteria bacterium]|nr:methyltransferase [Deltaproteobacteria bacterium]
MKDLIEGFGRVSTHAGMLKDNERVSKYASAIKKIVQPGDVVADIGAGSGVLSAIAAQCGAKKVFAVEAGAMAEFASRIIKDNSLEAIVKVIRIDARDVEFEEQPDVIVSETLGNCGFDEGIDGLLQTVARRCKQDVKIIPLSYRVVTSLLMDDDIHTMVDNLNDVEGVCFSTLIDHIANSPLVSRIKPGEVVSEPGFHTSTLLAHDGTQSQFDFEMIILGDCTVNAVGCWFDAILAPG